VKFKATYEIVVATVAFVLAPYFSLGLFLKTQFLVRFSECLLMQNGMGGCLTLDREESKARRRSDEIDKQLGELAKQERNVIKILLLGRHLLLLRHGV